MAFGREIKRLREAAGESAAKLAKSIGVDDAKYRKWEERDSTPKAEDKELIEKYFGLSLDEIMKLKELPKNPQGAIFVKDAPELLSIN